MEFPGIDVESSARVSHDLGPTGRGKMISMQRGTLIGRHGDERGTGGPTATLRRSANVSEHPADYEFGAQGDMGVTDPCTNGWDEQTAVPLKRGSSRATVSSNIAEMRDAGHPQAQAVAASLRQARQSKRSKGRSKRKGARRGAR